MRVAHSEMMLEFPVPAKPPLDNAAFWRQTWRQTYLCGRQLEVCLDGLWDERRKRKPRQAGEKYTVKSRCRRANVHTTLTMPPKNLARTWEVGSISAMDL